MLRKSILAIVGLTTVLGGGFFAGTAYSSPRSHELKLTADHGAKRLMVQESTTATTWTNTSFGLFTADSIVVPASGQYRVQVSFTGESACSASSWCSMQFLVDGVETNPKSGSDFALDSPGGETWQSLGAQGTSDIITGTGTPRSVTVEVDVAVIGGGSWRLDDWNVAAVLWRV